MWTFVKNKILIVQLPQSTLFQSKGGRRPLINCLEATTSYVNRFKLPSMASSLYNDHLSLSPCLPLENNFCAYHSNHIIICISSRTSSPFYLNRKSPGADDGRFMCDFKGNLIRSAVAATTLLTTHYHPSLSFNSIHRQINSSAFPSSFTPMYFNAVIIMITSKDASDHYH